MPNNNVSPLQIERLPSSAKFDTHMWVDFVELLCLVSKSGSVSIADVLDRVREREDLGEMIEDEVDEENDYFDDIDKENAGINEYQDIGDPAAEIDDRWSRDASDWFVHLGYRQSAFNDFYPFALNNQQSELTLVSELTLKQSLYLFLLAAANSRYLPKNNRQKFYQDFENISLEVLRQCLPDNAEVHVFGTNPGKVGKYQEAHLYDRILTLAEDLRERVIVSRDHYPPTDHGDGGLDLVGWVPMGDSANMLLVIFGQCACSAEEWDTKQHTPSDQAWRNKIALSVPPSHMTFIPMCMRNAHGDWHRPQNIASILIDRLRFTKLLQRNHSVIKSQPSYEILQQIIQSKESIV